MLSKKTGVFFTAIFVCALSVLCADETIGHKQYGQLLPEFDRSSDEPGGIDPDKIAINGMEDYTIEVADRIIEFLHTLPTVPTPENKKELLGTWILQNETGTAVDGNSRRYEIEKIFDILSKDYDDGKLRLQCGPLFSYLSFAENGDIYIFVAFVIGRLRQIKLYDGKLYFYILHYNKWILDPIHEDGKYYYSRHPQREIFIP